LYGLPRRVTRIAPTDRRGNPPGNARRRLDSHRATVRTGHAPHRIRRAGAGAADPRDASQRARFGGVFAQVDETPGQPMARIVPGDPPDPAFADGLE